MTEAARIPEAPESALPPLLVAPPWTAPRSAEPAVLKLKVPKEPTTMRWAPGMREEWLTGMARWGSPKPLPEDTDWARIAGIFESGGALEADLERRRLSFVALIMQAPLEIGARLLADERYWGTHLDYGSQHLYQGAAARHGMAAYPFILHRAKTHRIIYGLEPYLDAGVAQLMIKTFGVPPNDRRADAWFRLHGSDAARLAVPAALRKPGPTRERAENALRLVAREHGHEAIIEAARHHGDAAAAAISALGVAPLDLYPDPLPEIPEAFDPDVLPQLLLRGREQALPASATRNFITMLLISQPIVPHKAPKPFVEVRPYAGVPQVVEALDPDSLAEFAWALYRADRHPKLWASLGVQHALVEFGNDETADRLAPIVRRWSKSLVWERSADNVLRLFMRLNTDSALRHLHMLSRKAEDPKRIRYYAEGVLGQLAEERGLTAEQLADRLVPSLGLDADGAMTLDYGSRTFRVGFDERLQPSVTDEEGDRRKTLPEPGVKDDDTLAPAAYQRFADLKKEVRTVASEQIRRLEQAMVTGRSWTPEEFRTLFVEHPLLRHIVRRLVWSAGSTAFRVAEDGTLADVRDDAFVPPGDAHITLPHPLLLEDRGTWAEVFADYAILQPFPQLGRAVHEPAEDERAVSRLSRFEGASVPNGPILGLVRAGWRLGEKESGGYQRYISLELGEKRFLVLSLEPGIRVVAPEDEPVQEIGRVKLATFSYGAGEVTFDELGPVQTSEILATLLRLTGS